MEHKYLFGVVQTNLKDLCEGYNEHNGQYIIPCPNCIEHAEELDIKNPEDKRKLYIKSDYSVGFCQRCKTKFFNPKPKHDDFALLDDEIKIPEFNYEVFSGNHELIKIPIDYYTMSKDYLEDEVDYLINRNPALEKLYPYLKFKFRKNKVVMPFFWNDEIIYYQTRMTLPRDKCIVPYFCPPINGKPIWINPLNRGSNEVIITEGIFGSIGAFLTYKGKIDTIAVQGSYLTNYQLWMLDQLGYSKYYIYYDEDIISENIIKIMKKYNPIIYSDLEIIHSELGDPEDDYLHKTIYH